MTCKLTEGRVYSTAKTCMCRECEILVQQGEMHKGMLAERGVHCTDCGRLPTNLMVCESNAGFYIGRQCGCGPYSRESSYFRERKSADEVLRGPSFAKIVSIHYFKPSGKWYTEDERVVWPRDPDHYNGWAPFSKVRRIKDMFAVCMDSPLGFPQFAHPEKS